MQWIRRVAALILSAAMLFCLTLGVSAFDSVSQDVQAAIEVESRVNDGLVDVELSYGEGISAKDWEALKNNGVTFQLHYYNSYYRFNPSSVSSTLGYSELNLSRTEIPDDLMDEICYKTDLEEDEFMVIMPAMLGQLPGTATVGICLDQDFINKNGSANLNIYGIDFLHSVSYRDADKDDSEEDIEDDGRVRESDYAISAIGLAASGRSAQKSWSPWITFTSNVSRVLIVTAKSVSTYGSMGWSQSGGSIQNTSGITENTSPSVVSSNPGGTSSSSDPNPNTGAVSVQTVLACGIAALGAASALTLARSLRSRKHRQ